MGKSILEKTLTRWPVFVDHFSCDWEAATMLRAFPLAKKGEGRARLPSLYASFGKLGETPTHKDIIDNNRSINWPV
nr:hypothetical protein [Escherichia coli]